MSWLWPAWRQILVVHVVYIGLGFIVFAPLLGALGQVLLKMSGEPVLADMDLHSKPHAAPMIRPI